jgi:hypothetical protein
MFEVTETARGVILNFLEQQDENGPRAVRILLQPG